MTMDRILPAGGLGPKAGTDTSAAAERPRHPWHDEAINIATRAATTPQAQAREITVQEAAEVPEVKALIEAASAMVLHDGWGTVQYTDNRMWGDAEAVQSALRAIAAMQKGG